MGVVYVKSDGALKTNERSTAKRIPLLSELPCYSERGEEARRRAKTLHNHPVSSSIDYFIINLRDSSDVNDKESSGHLEHKLRMKVGENEEDIKNRVVSEPIEIEWAFKTFKARHYEPSGKPISRIAKQLNTSGTVIGKELGIGVRTPEGGWGWIGRERSELGSLCRVLTNREMFGSFRG